MDENQDDACEKGTLLGKFLRELAKKAENGSLTDKEHQELGEFYMSWLFSRQAEKDIKRHKKKDRKINPKDDIMKFLCLGWYVYTKLLNNETL